MTTQTVSNAVAQRREDRTAIDFMMSKRGHLRTVLPRSVDVDAFVGTAAGALYANKTLMDYAIGNVDSLFIALMKCAQLGHMPGTDEFYLTPRQEKGRGKVLGIEGYRGVIERMYRSGAVSKVVVREVCENDYFLYVEGEMDKPVHRWGGDGETGASFFKSKPRGAMVGAYAYADLVTGATSRVVTLTEDDVLAARDSGGYKATDPYTPWNRLDGGQAHPEFKGRSMWWKTGAKRLEPWVPTSAEYRRESLRASASAAEHAVAGRQTPELPASAPPENVVDAEIVDDPTDAASGDNPPPPAPEAAQNPAERPPALIASGQKTQIEREQHRLGYGDSEEDLQSWLSDLARLAGLAAIASVGELTQADAKAVIGQLKPLGDAQDLMDLLATGEVPGE
jgi:recombination protein RecT